MNIEKNNGKIIKRDAKKLREKWLKDITIARDGSMKLKMKFLSCHKSEGWAVYSDYEKYLIEVAAEDLIELPTDGNVRFLNLDSDTFISVYNTITSDIKKLQDYHLGGDIFANFCSIDYENKIIEFTFESTEMGAVNGNTSLCAILFAKYMNTLKSGNVITFRVRNYKKSKLSKAQREECVRNAVSLNNVKAQTNDAICYSMGYYDVFIEELLEEYRKLFDFKPNDENDKKNSKVTNKLQGNVILRILEAMNIVKYPDANSSPRCVNNGIGGLLKWYISEMQNESNDGKNPYEFLLPLLNTFIKFYAFILYHWDDSLKESISIFPENEEILKTLSKTKVVTLEKDGEKVKEYIIDEIENITAFTYINKREYSRKGKIGADAYAWAVFSAFRANIDYNSETGEIGFKVDLYKLWDRVNLKLWTRVYETLNGECKGAVTEFVKSSAWSELYKIVSMEINQMILEGKRVVA